MHCLPGYTFPCAAGGCIGPDASPHCLHLFVGQCSFPRAIAHAACAALPDCHVLTCPRSLHVCQARRGSAVPVPSWGNDDVFADGTALQRLVNFAPAPNASACDARNVAAHSAAAVLAHASSVSVVACESAAEGGWSCKLQPLGQPHRHAAMLAWLQRHTYPDPLLAAAGRRERTTSLASPPIAPTASAVMASAAMASTGNTRRGNLSAILLRHGPTITSHRLRLQRQPVLYAPQPGAAAELAAEPGSLEDYLRMAQGNHFLSDALVVYHMFFAGDDPAADGRTPFFLEVGGATGTADGSNTFLFERFLKWRGLMVEAHPPSFAKLVTQRPAAYRLLSALCNASTPAYFGVAYGQVRAGTGGVGTSETGPMSCTPLGGLLRALDVPRVDFWSLDVEGNEWSVMRGMDWSVPVSVMLIESVLPHMAAFLRAKGYVRLRREDYVGSQKGGRDQIWYDPHAVSPRTERRRIRVSSQPSQGKRGRTY